MFQGGKNVDFKTGLKLSTAFCHHAMLVGQVRSHKQDCFTVELPDFAWFLFSFLGEDFKVEVRDAPHGMMPPHKSTPKRVEHQANRVRGQLQKNCQCQ